MNQAETVEALILSALNNLNEELPPEQQIKVTPTTVLFGVDAEVDSLSLVSLIVDIESDLHTKLGLEVALVDDRAMNREILPFTSVQTLLDYIVELAREQE